ncbi:hypothetical protein [Stappia stellulata]|uniref:hypothetical protein n=1 Tax=Stappia stellulata TaxID=71235 RepID=UPI0012EC2880|nr:hypothetical protein [Stappia stellulata]
MSFPVSISPSKVLGNCLSNEQMVGSAKPTGPSHIDAVALDDSKTLGARIANPQMVGSGKPVGAQNGG